MIGLMSFFFLLTLLFAILTRDKKVKVIEEVPILRQRMTELGEIGDFPLKKVAEWVNINQYSEFFIYIIYFSDVTKLIFDIHIILIT